MKKESFNVLSDIEHVLLRPAIYIGSVDKNLYNDYFFTDNKMTYQEVEFVQGFVKIINEVIDNCVDEALRTKFKFGNRIKVSFDDEKKSIIIEDNGRGIPVELHNDKYRPELAWCSARSGTNFVNESRETIGMNGLGVFLTSCYSTEFIGETHDGKSKCIVKAYNNLSSIETKVSKSSKQGTKVEFIPDLKRFSLKIKDVFSKDSLYKRIIYQRLFNLSICFPDISFIFNGKTVKTGNTKSIFSLFGDSFEHANNNNCMFAIYPNNEDNFRYYTYINGIHLPNGGSHIDIISNELTQIIREKLSKKYKGIKPGEIKNKLFITFYGLNFPSPKFDSQTKEKLTNSTKEIRDYISGIDLEKLANKIMRNEDLINPIIEIYKIKEEYKKKQEIGELSKKSKKIRDDKYLPPIGSNEYLILGEGSSAVGGLSNALGRNNIGYYELRGVPLNTYEEKSLTILSNKEMKTILEILNLDTSRTTKSEDSQYYKLRLNDEDIIFNKNDDVCINGNYVSVIGKDYIVEPIEINDELKVKYESQKCVRRQFEDKDMSYKYVLFGTDQDLDGMHIRGLLLGFFMRVAPNLIKEGRVKQLRTPLIILKKGNKINHFFFTFDEYNEWCEKNSQKGYELKYMKGLGSWKQEELIQLFDKYDFSFFADELKWTYDSERYIHEWLSSSEVQKRKDYLMVKCFNMFKA